MGQILNPFGLFGKPFLKIFFKFMHLALFGHALPFAANADRGQIARKQKRRSVSGVLDEYGAGNETRTRDPDLGKVVLYQLSYSRKWRPLGDSNPCYRRERAVS